MVKATPRQRVVLRYLDAHGYRVDIPYSELLENCTSKGLHGLLGRTSFNETLKRMVDSELIKRVRRGFYQITDKGREKFKEESKSIFL